MGTLREAPNSATKRHRPPILGNSSQIHKPELASRSWRACPSPRTPAGTSKIGSSQSRVAKAEGTVPGVAFDLMLRAFFATGGTVDELAQAIGS
jgi:hypothetical protein